MTEIDYQAIEAYALAEVAKHAPELEAAALVNTEKVITAFRNNMVSDYYLKPTTGYGYSDVGRDTLDLIYAEIFKTEAALVRSHFVSGTHALAVALLGNLRPGDELVGLTGTPYDTMQSIIGYPVKTKGSLVDLGVTYKELPMSGEHVDLEAVKKIVTKNTKMVHIHTLMCYSDIHADLETSADWEKTIQALSFEPAKDLAMVARSQIGYAESQRNYKVAEDGITKRGYTRYGEWYGNPYGDWNAMFVSFCLRYAQHPAYETLKNSGADSMRVAAVNAGVYQAASGAVPYVGDLAFLDKDSNGSCDTVAIVSGRQSGSMTLVEGDCGAVVAEKQYSLSNGTVLGYALLTAQPKTADALLDGETTGAPAGGEDAQLTNGDNITITFKINNSDYTHDPGSGYTHVKVDLAEKNNPAADGYFVGDGGLSYEHWIGNTHKITGTGILMTRSIPAGTTLAGSDYGLPNISSTNITESNTYSYVLPHSWVTDGERICNDKTVFTEDTTLYLSLYSNEEHYNLNKIIFLC